MNRIIFRRSFIFVIILFLCLLFNAFPVFAYSDIGLLKNQKTIGFFILSPTNSMDISSGLVYNQKQNEKIELEISCTNYYKIYPFMKNIIKVKADGKYKLLNFGRINVAVLAGPVIYYASSVGAGLATNIGGIISINISNKLALSLTTSSILFKDGIGCEIEPMINLAPAFLKNMEIYCGARLEASMVGFTSEGLSNGKINYYLDTGMRIGI